MPRLTVPGCRDAHLTFRKASSIIHDDYVRHAAAPPAYVAFSRAHRLAHTVGRLDQFQQVAAAVRGRVDRALQAVTKVAASTERPGQDDACGEAAEGSPVRSPHQDQPGGQPPLAVRRLAGAAEATARLADLRALQLCCARDGKFADAHAACLARLDLAKAVAGHDSTAAGDCLLDLALLSRHVAAERSKAVPLCKLALQVFHAADPAEGRLLALCACATLGEVFADEGEAAHATAMRHKVVVAATRLAEEGNTPDRRPEADRSPTGALAFADMLLARGLYDSAEAVYAEVVRFLGHEPLRVTTAVTEAYCCLAALYVRAGRMGAAEALLLAASDKFEALPASAVSAEDRLIMSRVLFQRGKHAAARGHYRKAVSLLLLTLRIRRQYRKHLDGSRSGSVGRSDEGSTGGHAAAAAVDDDDDDYDVSALIAESEHAVSVLGSLDSTLEKLVEASTVPR